jgi:hypothetical protein
MNNTTTGVSIGNAVYESPAAFREALFAKWDAQSKHRMNRKHQEVCPRCERKNVNLYRHTMAGEEGLEYGHWACKDCWDDYKSQLTDEAILSVAAELAAEANHAPRDMSGSCGAAYLDNFRKLMTGEWTDVQWTEWWTNNCGRCIHMHEECTKNWDEVVDISEEAAQIIREVEAAYVSGTGDVEPSGVIELGGDRE